MTEPSAAEFSRFVQEAREQRERAEQAEARAAHFESLAKDQQATNAAMVASLKRGLAELKTSEAECARLRALLERSMEYFDYMEDRGYRSVRVLRSDVAAALAATLRHPERIRQAQDELRRMGQGKLGRPPAGEGYPTTTCDHPEMADRQLVAPTTFRAVCWCGRNYACPTCGFGAFTLSHECASPAPAVEDEAGESKPRLYLFQSTCGICGTEIGGDGDVCEPCATDPVRRERFSALKRAVRRERGE
jgi:hypothetical protein